MSLRMQFVDLGAILGLQPQDDDLLALTFEELRPLVGDLPDAAVAYIAQGPMEDPHCRLCRGFRLVPEDGSPADDAAYRLSCYHALSKERIRPLTSAILAAGAQADYRPLADELNRFVASIRYHRAQVIYLLCQERLRV